MLPLPSVSPDNLPALTESVTLVKRRKVVLLDDVFQDICRTNRGPSPAEENGNDDDSGQET